MANNKITIKKARALYFKAFPQRKFTILTAHIATCGIVLNAYEEKTRFDTVLVRYDGIIFRDHKQVYPEVNSNGLL